MPIVCYLFVIIFKYMLIMLRGNIIIELLFNMKYELVEWLSINLALAWLWVQVMENLN